MNALVLAEVLKLRTTRMFAWLLLATLAFVVLTVAFGVPSAGATGTTHPLDEPALLARLVGDSFGVPEVAMVLLGLLAFTQEVRYGSISSTFLVEPRRRRVLVAKGVALVFASVALTVPALAVSTTLSMALIRSKDGNVAIGAQFGQVAAAVFVVMALYGLIGLAIGALVRNQIVAVVAVLVWSLAVERLLIAALPQIERWTPLGATLGLLQLDPIATPRGTLLSAPVGGLLLAGYATAAVALALVVAPRRDIY